MADFAGIRSTNDFGTDERPKSFREMILWLQPNGDAPLYALTQFFPDEGVTDPEFSWWTEDMDVVRLLTTATYSASSTAFEVQVAGTTNTRGTALQLVQYDLLWVEGAVSAGTQTNEILEVSSVASATSFVVKRGARGSTAAGIAGQVFLFKIGNAWSEGANGADPASRNPTKYYNYTQIFKTAYAETRTTLETKFRTGDPLKNDRQRKMFDHSADIEMALIFGRRYEEASGPNGEPRRTTGGLLDPSIGLSTTVFATTPTEKVFIDNMEPIFQKAAPTAGNERIAFCGNGFLGALNNMVATTSSTRITYDGEIKIRGMVLRRYNTPFGSVAFKTHPLMTRNPRYTNSALVVAPGLIRRRVIHDTEDQQNIQGNDADAKKNQFLTEVGFEIHHPSLMRHYHIIDPSQ